MTGVERAAAQARHPSARWAVDTGPAQARIAAGLAAAGHPWPSRAASLLAVRGRLGLDRPGLAALLGVPESAVAAVEDGTESPDQAWVDDGHG